jgi:hypothetical protein
MSSVNYNLTIFLDSLKIENWLLVIEEGLVARVEFFNKK